MTEYQRIRRPGVTIVVTDWCRNFFIFRSLHFIYRMLRPSHNRILSTRDMSELLISAGYSDVKAAKYKVGLIWGMMTVQGRTPTNGKPEASV